YCSEEDDSDQLPDAGASDNEMDEDVEEDDAQKEQNANVQDNKKYKVNISRIQTSYDSGEQSGSE
ncbi:MAG: hypothetical protein EZS28_045547, partial [Streblomastix strix]